jgi:hypothetical protein
MVPPEGAITLMGAGLLPLVFNDTETIALPARLATKVARKLPVLKNIVVTAGNTPWFSTLTLKEPDEDAPPVGLLLESKVEIMQVTVDPAVDASVQEADDFVASMVLATTDIVADWLPLK